MKSTDKTAVQKIAPGTYRVVEVGGRSAVTGRYVRAINAARHAWSTNVDAAEATAGSATRRSTTAARSKTGGRFATDRTGARTAR